jgi:glycosyltransferase involved in cell wall biosynthesis
MKVLQLIDSLHAGGAERVAVNYANSLASRIETSFLCSTREEGMLKTSLSKDVQYLFLNKKSTLDIKAISKLHRFVKRHKINIIHAHASSFFIATIIKILNPEVVLIWHDHYGNSEFLNKRPKKILKICSLFFNHVFFVNTKLKAWAKKNLHVKSSAFLANFAVLNITEPITNLRGEDAKRIVCLANLRPQKDHITLLKAFQMVFDKHSDWTLHLIGQDFEDDYSNLIKSYIKMEGLEQNVFIYGSCPDIDYILSQSAIGVLSSKSEGLPLALLEYGLAELPVIATNVGDCNKVVSNKDEGILVEPKNDKVLAEALLIFINDPDLKRIVAKNLKHKIVSDFSESSTLETLMEIYKKHQK